MAADVCVLRGEFKHFMKIKDALLADERYHGRFVAMKNKKSSTWETMRLILP